METLYLCFFAFLAGFVDSVVGGGGLIQLPALFLFLPPAIAQSIPTVFGTNKMAAVCGTSMAVVQYARRVRINWHSIAPAGCTAFLFSFLGAHTVRLIDTDTLKKLIFFLLVAVAAYTALRKNFGELHAPKFRPTTERLVGILVGAAIGFYDGFFGPGTGSFLIFIFISLFGFDFLSASASAKFINVATNISALLYFGFTGHIAFAYALPMGASNLAGAWLGSRLAILKGNKFVRGFFLIVVAAMILRFGWESVGAGRPK